MYKSIFSTLLIVLIYSQVNGQNHTLKVNISGIKNESGQLEACLAYSKDTFMRHPEQCNTALPKGASQVQMVFEDLESGDYAISIMHDVNDNGHLDLGFMKIPKEPYGFSNNPSTTFGPPSFNEAAFEVNQDLTISIEL